MLKLKFIGILLLVVLSSDALCQEKRLALVIGNSNYSERLPNPVNDALLMKSTLESLDFDVILDTNVSKISDFEAVVREFGDRRADYDVGFIYYAGHGVQIENVNYLLATDEKYITKFDVEDNALSVQKIMRYLIARSNEVNVIILDACRNNPFEKNWDPKARSVEGGRGLAKMEPPTGSLIAFSTDAGNTAADGSKANSDYCLSLTKNMLIENLTLDQVFRNVRMDVLQMSDGKQRPIEQSQLTGQAFYLKKSSYTNEIIRIDSLIESENYVLALEKANMILAVDPDNKSALLRKGRINYLLPRGEFYNGAELLRAKELYPEDPEVHIYLARFYAVVGDYSKSIDAIYFAIGLDSLYADAFYWKSKIYGDYIGESNFALESINKAIDLSPLNEAYHLYRGRLQAYFLDLPNQASKDFDRAYELAPNDLSVLISRADYYSDYLNDYRRAILDFERVLNLQPNNIEALNSLGIIYEESNQPDSALIFFERGISLERNSPSDAAFCYTGRARIFASQGKMKEALRDYSKAIELDKDNSAFYSVRGGFFKEVVNDFKRALLDFSMAIEIDETKVQYLLDRAYLYNFDLKQRSEAILDLNRVLQIDSLNAEAILLLALFYDMNGQTDLALAQYERGIALESSNPGLAGECYSGRAEIFVEQNSINHALEDFSNSIRLNPNDPLTYKARGDLYLYELQDSDKALLDYSKAIQLDSTDTDLLFNRGNLYLDYFNKSADALRDFRAILAINPTDVRVLNAIGLIYKSENRLELAIEQFETGILQEEESPEFAAQCYLNRASIYEEQDRITDALSDYSRAVELDSRNSDFYAARAEFFKDRMTDPHNALIDYSRAIELDSNNVDLLLTRGLLYLQNLNQPNKAIIDFNRIIDFDSVNVSAINNIGYAYETIGSLDSAIVYYSIGVDFGSYDSVSISFCYRNRADVYARMNRIEEALRDYNSAISINGTDANVYLARGNFFGDQNDFRRAIDDYSRAIELDPLNSYAYYSRGYLLGIKLDNYQESVYDLEFSLKIDSTYSDAILMLGFIHDFYGKTDLAIKQYEKGILLKENNPILAAECYASKGYINFECGNIHAAMSDYNKAIELDPNNSDYYLDRAEFYLNQNKKYNALIDFALGISLDPLNSDMLYWRSRLFSDEFAEHDSAIEDCEKIISNDSNEVTILNWIGIYYHRQLNDSMASVYYDKVIRKDGFKFQDSIHAYSDGIAWAYNNRALLYQKQNELAIPTSYYNRTIEIDRSPIRFYSRGWFLALYLHEFDKAIQDLTVAIELDEKNPIWYLSRAKLYYLQGNQKLAKKDFDVAVKLSDEDSYYLAARGNYFSLIGEYSKAASDFEHALKVKPDDSMTFHFITENYIRQGKFDEAMENAMNSSKRFENDTTSFEQLGRIYFMQKKYLKSLGAYQKAVYLMEFDKRYKDIDPKMETLFLSDLYLTIAEIYKFLGDADLQCESLRKADACLKDETRPGKVEIENDISSKVRAICN